MSQGPQRLSPRGEGTVAVIPTPPPAPPRPSTKKRVLGERTTRVKNAEQKDRGQRAKGSKLQNRKGRVGHGAPGPLRAAPGPLRAAPALTPALPARLATLQHKPLQRTNYLLVSEMGPPGRRQIACLAHNKPGVERRLQSRAWSPCWSLGAHGGRGRSTSACLEHRAACPRPHTQSTHKWVTDFFQENHAKRWEPCPDAFYPLEKVGCLSHPSCPCSEVTLSSL